jgi:hypothetical protein
VLLCEKNNHMRYTQEQMQVTVNEWQNSKLSKKEFCRELNINYPTFHYWCKRGFANWCADAFHYTLSSVLSLPGNNRYAQGCG